MKLSVGAQSDTGRVRQGNEDSYLTRDPLFIVADGMGGHKAGEVASAAAVDVLSSVDNLGPGDLEDLVKKANSAILSKAKADAGLKGMGTTATVILVEGNKAHLAHVGDSRAYLLRDGKLEQLTQDHTLVARLVREGKISAEEARHHPQRSIITRALGVDLDVKVDVSSLELKEGDRILICSDGLTSMVDAPEIERVLNESDEPQEGAQRLIEIANEAGGEDNITVIVLDAGKEGARASAATREAAEPETALDEPRRPRSRALLTLSLVALLTGGLWLGGQYALNNLMWFVGVDTEGHVAIFHGVPEEVGGLSLSNLAESTDLIAADLPGFVRGDVEEGHRVGSLEEAHSYIENIRERASDFEGGQPTPTPSNKT